MTKEDSERLVGSETVRMLELGHPWVVADAYTRKWPTGTAGQTVELCDSQSRFLATALLDRLLYHCEVINLSGKSFRMKNQKTIFNQNEEK